MSSKAIYYLYKISVIMLACAILMLAYGISKSVTSIIIFAVVLLVFGSIFTLYAFKSAHKYNISFDEIEEINKHKRYNRFKKKQ